MGLDRWFRMNLETSGRADLISLYAVKVICETQILK
jgi:hypothetical protein